jgi:hypothetical protein
VTLRLCGAAGFHAALPFACIAARRFARVSSETSSLIVRGDVDRYAVAGFDQADSAALFGFRRDMADREARRAAGEAAVGDQRADFPESLRLEVAGGIEHFLHAGAAARTLVADDDAIETSRLISPARSSSPRIPIKARGQQRGPRILRRRARRRADVGRLQPGLAL